MNSMGSSYISVIIPVYNTEESQFKTCIDSVCRQTLHNIEIIIVDDGSTEKCRKMIDEVAGSDIRIKVIHKKNGGVSSARNAGLDVALSDYIMFVDSDDWIEEQCCERAYDTAVEESTDLVMWRYVKEYQGKTLEVQIYPESRLRFDYWKEQFNPFDMRIMGMCWMKLYKRNILKNIRFNETLTNGEDVEFNFRAYERIHSAVYISEPFYHYRQNTASAVRKYVDDMPVRYQKTLNIISEDVRNAKRLRKHLVKAFYSFTGISYLVLNMNYIFTKENQVSTNKKMEQLRQLSMEKPYCDAIRRAESLELPFTRKLSLIFAKYHFYIGIYLIMMAKFLMNRMYNLKRRSE